MPMILNAFVFNTPLSLLEIITNAGLTANLVLCLDAGDSASYDGTSQTWTDVSGGSQSFFRGSSSASQGSDPTFNGVAGNRSANEYFSVDGGDWFTETSSALNFAESWHKNNAAFTFGFVIYAKDGDGPAASFESIFNNEVTGNLISGPGIKIFFNDPVLKIDVSRDTGLQALHSVLKSNFLPVSRDWLCGIITMNEATGDMLVKTSSSAAAALTGKTYTSPSSSGSSQNYSLMADSDGGNPFDSGVRLACVFAWNRVLTTGELDTVYTALKLRFPTLA